MKNNIPPQSVEIERAVLGANMLDSSAIGVTSDVLVQESFYIPAHKKIYSAQMLLYRSGNPIDMLTVSEQLKKMGALDDVGGPGYLIELTNTVASAANVEFHARIIAQKYTKRQLREYAMLVGRAAMDDSADDFQPLEVAEKNLLAISQGFNSKGAQTIGSAALKSLRLAETAMRSGGGVVGIPTNIHAVDAITGGWRNTDLVIIAARPGMGKTSFVINCAYEAAMTGMPVLFFSLEMSADQIATRAMCAARGIDSKKVRNGKLSEDELRMITEEADRFQSLPFYIDDSAGLSISQVRSIARRHAMKHGLKMVVVDYIQLMSGSGAKGQNREQEISEISRGLKMLAKELDVPVIALSQLSRSVETRGGTKRPILSDLRESGAIEQDADIVSFIFRPEYYGITEDENGQSLVGVAEIIFAKHRSGPLDIAKVRFVDSLTKFTNLEDTQQYTQFPAQRQESYIPF